MMTDYILKIDESGRIQLSQGIMKELHLTEGSVLKIKNKKPNQIELEVI